MVSVFGEWNRLGSGGSFRDLNQYSRDRRTWSNHSMQVCLHIQQQRQPSGYWNYSQYLSLAQWHTGNWNAICAVLFLNEGRKAENLSQYKARGELRMGSHLVTLTEIGGVQSQRSLVRDHCSSYTKGYARAEYDLGCMHE